MQPQTKPFNPLPPSLERRRRQNSTGWMLLAAVLMFATMLAQQSYGRTASQDATSGNFYWSTSSAGAAYQPALHLGTDVTMDIRGLTAAVTVKQTFTNTGDKWKDGVYVFPLPENSAVNQMRMTIGERIIEGAIAEKAEAKRAFEAAKAEGRKAALVEQERPNLFTQSVANIAPGETVAVELRYLQTLDYDQGTFSLRFPMTLTPRYVPGEPLPGTDDEQAVIITSTGWAKPTDAVPDADPVRPRYIPPNNPGVVDPISLAITLDAGYPLNSVMSPSHKLRVDMRGSGVRQIQLADEAVPMDRDFVLRWRPQVSREATAALFHESRDGDSYLQLMLLPPVVRDEGAKMNRELVLVIDTSGSMSGPSIQQAKQCHTMGERENRRAAG